MKTLTHDDALAIKQWFDKQAAKAKRDAAGRARLQEKAVGIPMHENSFLSAEVTSTALALIYHLGRPEGSHVRSPFPYDHCVYELTDDTLKIGSSPDLLIEYRFVI